MIFSLFRRDRAATRGKRREMPPAVRELASSWATLTSDIPGLTEEMEREFRFGQSVIALDGRYRMGGNLKGGSSAMWIPADRRAWEAYNLWRDRDGLPRKKDRRAFRRLLKLLNACGVELANGSWSGADRAEKAFSEKRGVVYALIYDVLRRLPRGHLSRPELRTLQIGGWGPDGAKASAYDAGTVMLYDFAINGARRTFLGLLLHELGHVQEAAFSDDLREELRDHHGVLAGAGAVIGVEFLLDPQARRLYQMRVFEEFAAEVYMIYTALGTRLRAYVDAMKGPPATAWRRVYDIYRDAFMGVEYR